MKTAALILALVAAVEASSGIPSTKKALLRKEAAKKDILLIGSAAINPA